MYPLFLTNPSLLYTSCSDVAESRLAKHVKSCPDRLDKQRSISQPCYRAGCNCGPGSDYILPPAPPELANAKGDVNALSVRRQALAVRKGPAYFAELLERVTAAADLLNPASDDCLSVIEPPEAKSYIELEESAANKRFSRKHALQQASIAGNMKRKGLMRPKEEGITYVELGAGRGYLSLSMAECFGVEKLALVDVRGFKLKADRAMRHLQLERIRCDLADFNPRGLDSVKEGGKWVAMGKHLCGAATDFALRCCANNSNTNSAGTDSATVTEDSPSLLGLAIATCCHHRCTWRHFAGRDVLEEQGFCADEFEVISWATGWALCGHEAPAGGAASSSRSSSDNDTDSESNCGDGDDNGKGTDRIINLTEATASTIGAQQQNTNLPVKRMADGDAKQQKTETVQDWRPHNTYSRAERIKIGQTCKRLLDGARLAWLKNQGFASELVWYIDPTISGENTLLLALPQGAKEN